MALIRGRVFGVRGFCRRRSFLSPSGRAAITPDGTHGWWRLPGPGRHRAVDRVFVGDHQLPEQAPYREALLPELQDSLVGGPDRDTVTADAVDIVIAEVERACP
jgi:hypothetical protein